MAGPQIIAIAPQSGCVDRCSNAPVRTNFGTVTLRVVDEGGSRVWVPGRFISSDEAASFVFEGQPEVHLRRRGLEVVLGSRGIFVGRRFTGEYLEPTVGMARRAPIAIVTDGGLQRAFLTAVRDLTLATFEVTAAADLPPAKVVYTPATTKADEYAQSTQTVAAGVRCEIGEMVSTVTEIVYAMVQKTGDIVADGAQCALRCVEAHPWDLLRQVQCHEQCAAKALTDAASVVLEAVGSIEREVRTPVLWCENIPANWPPTQDRGAPDAGAGLPSIIGRIPSGEIIGDSGFRWASGGGTPDVGPLMKALEESILCLAAGRWTTWDVDMPIFGLDAPLPIGVKVCIDIECFRKINESLLPSALAAATLLGTLISAGGLDAAVAAFLAKMPAVAPALTALAAQLGISLSLVYAAVLTMLIVIVYQIAAISAQVYARLAFGGGFPSGELCLQHPLLLLGAVAVFTAPTVIGPILAAQVAVNFPVIVVDG